MNADPLNAIPLDPVPPARRFRRSLAAYTLAFGVIAAVLYVLDLTTIVLALVGIITFAAGYSAGWHDRD